MKKGFFIHLRNLNEIPIKKSAFVMVLLFFSLLHVYERLDALILISRISITLGIAIFFIFAICSLWRYGPSLNRLQKGVIFGITFLGVLQAMWAQDLQPAREWKRDHVDVYMPNGKKKEDVRPVAKWIEGRVALIYLLSSDPNDGRDIIPSYVRPKEAKEYLATPPNRIVKSFTDYPEEVNILFARPRARSVAAPSSLQMEIIGYGPRGEIGYKEDIDLIPGVAQRQERMESRVAITGGISSVDIRVKASPEIKQVTDPLYVGFEEEQVVWAYLSILGKLILLGASFAVSAYTIILCGKNIPFPKWSFSARVIIPIMTLSLSVLALAYWVEKDNDIVAWVQNSKEFVNQSLGQQSRIDYFLSYYDRYWDKNQILYNLASIDWREAMRIIGDQYTDDYTMIPVIIPTLLNGIIGPPSTLKWLFLVIILYAVPAYILTAYLSKYLAEGERATASAIGHSWIYGSSVIFFSFPIFLYDTFRLYPDIGGVILFAGALLAAILLFHEIVDNPTSGHRVEYSEKFITTSLGLGLLLSAMFLFRRWYLLASAGIVIAMVLLLAFEIFVNRGRSLSILRRAFVAIPLIAFPALFLLIWVFFEWSTNLEARNYFKAYKIYQWWDIAGSYKTFINFFGYLPILLSLVFFFLWLNSNPTRRSKRAVFLVALSAFISVYLFLQIQVISTHHIYMMMPFWGGTSAALFLLLLRRFGRMVAFGFAIIITFGGAISTWYRSTDSQPNIVQDYFPNYQYWLPLKKQIALSPLEDILRWLTLEENRDKKVCSLFPPIFLTPPIIFNSWELFPDIKKKATEDLIKQRFIDISILGQNRKQIIEAVNQCNIILLSGPSYPAREVNSPVSRYARVIYDEIASGTGIGAAYNRTPEVFTVNVGTKLLAYRINDPRDEIQVRAYMRTRLFSDKEYNDLLKRFTSLEETPDKHSE